MNEKLCNFCNKFYSSDLTICPNCGEKLDVICNRCKNPLRYCVCKD